MCTMSLAMPATRAFLPPTWTETISPHILFDLPSSQVLYSTWEVSHVLGLRCLRLHIGYDVCCALRTRLSTFFSILKLRLPTYTRLTYARTRIIIPIDRSKKLDTSPESLVYISAFHAPHPSLLPATRLSCTPVSRLRGASFSKLHGHACHHIGLLASAPRCTRLT